MRLAIPAGVRWPLPDFLPRPARPPWLAWAALACAALLCALVADEVLALQGEREAVARELERARAAARPARAEVPPAPAPRETLLAAQGVARRLAHPWGELLGAVESAAAPGLRWVRLEHDAERGDMRLSALAPHRDAVLATLDRLAALPGWSEVSLQRLEQDPASPALRVELRARFGDAPVERR